MQENRDRMLSMNTAILQVLAERISAAYATDTVKPVWTPFELAEQMLSAIKLDGSILVLSDLGFLPVLKSRGVGLDQITFVAHTPEQELLATQMRVGRVLQVGYNDPIKELEKQLMGFKFDIVIGNPPYQNTDTNSLFAPFVINGLRIKTGVMIVPGTWLSKSTGVLGALRRELITTASSVDFLSKEDCVRKLKWPAIIGGATVISWGIVSDVIRIRNLSTGTEQCVNRTNLQALPFTPVDSLDITIVSNILAKVQRSRSFMSERHRRGRIGSKAVQDLPEGQTLCHQSYGRTRLVDITNHHGQRDSDTWRVAFNYALGSKMTEPRIFKPGETCTESFLYFVCSSQEECEQLIAYTQTTVFHFLRKLMVFDHNATAKTFSLVPAFETYPTSDELAKSMLGLSELEMQEIKMFVLQPDAL